MTDVLFATLAGGDHPAASDLYTVDPATAVMTSIGPIGAAISGLAVDPTSGILYGSDGFFVANPGIWTIDKVTGAGTFVGHFAGGSDVAHDLAFDAGGQLWATGGGGKLYSVNKATGLGTPIGTNHISGGGMDFLASTLYRIGPNGQIQTQDTTTGAITFIRNLSDGNDLHSGKFDGSGVFWAGSPASTGHAGQNLVHIDISTGTVTVVGAFSVPGVGGLAWVAVASAPFSLAAAPNSFSVNVGAPAVFHSTITSTKLSGPPENITLSVDSAPITGVTTGIVPTVITDDGGSATLTITLDGTTPLGDYSISIKGDDGSGGIDHTSVALHIVAPPPGIHIAS